MGKGKPKRKKTPPARVTAEPKAVGRPTSNTTELGDLICALLAEGKSLRTICALDTMPSLSTVLLWVVKGERKDEQYAAFSEQYACAREAQMEALLDEVVEISDDDKGDFGFKETEDKDGKSAKPVVLIDNINRAKLRIETRFKYASKMHRRKFGEKTPVALTGPNDKPLTFSINIGDAGSEAD